MSTGRLREVRVKRFLVVAIGLLVLLPSRSAFAEKQFYVLGGATLANLGGDAESFGTELADTLEQEVGGSWDSNKKMRTGFDFGVGFSYSKSGSWGGAAELHYVQRGAKSEPTETSG